MTVLPRPSGTARLGTRELVIGAVVALVAAGVTFHDPRTGGLMLVVLAAAAIVGVIALRDPAMAALLLLACSYGREAIKGDVLTYSVYALMLACAIAMWTRRRPAPKVGTPELLIALYLLWNLASMILPHPTPTDDQWHFVIKGVIIPLGLYLVGRWAFDREQMINFVLWAVAAFTVYSTFNAYFQIHGPKSLVFPKVTITESGWTGRAVGVFNQPVVNGVLLTIGFAVLLYLASDDRLRTWLRVALVAAAAGALYAVTLTDTRSALLALVVVVVLGALFARGWRLPFVVTLVLGALVVAFNFQKLTGSNRDAGGLGSSYEVIDRLNIAATAFRAIRENPWAGIGLNRFSTYNTDHHTSWSPDLPWANGYGNVAHETELGITAELGVPGVILWLAVLITIAIAVIRALYRLPAREMLGGKFAFLALAALVTWEINATTVDMRLLDFANALPFLLMGIAVGLHERWRAQGRLVVDDHPPAGMPSPRGPGSGPLPVGRPTDSPGSHSPTGPRRPEPVA